MKPKLLSWTGQPNAPQTPYEVHWRADIASAVLSLSQANQGTITYGNGRSYGDVCYAKSSNVLHTRRLNRIISADWTKGILRAECGITLGEILELSVPRGWFLAVTPGTKHVTLGGAIANDVHGKNHHRRGTFGNHVRAFNVIRTDRAPCLCTLETNPELFKATIGGLGLTGVVEWAEIQLVAIRAAALDTVTQRFDTVDEFLGLSTELDNSNEYGVAWVDCTAKGPRLGRGIYISANHASTGSLTPHGHNVLSVPVTPPFSVINSITTRTFNTINWNLQRSKPRSRLQHYDPYFYPLDRLQDWNRLYGRAGFQQFQCVVPIADARDALTELLGTISNSGAASFLTVLKRCGAIASPGLLSFPLPGISLAIDFPQSSYLSNSLLPKLDKIVHAAGGRLYPAKDAHMTGDDFRKAYPAWQQVEQLRDPAFMSQFWARVTS